jgi:hypothetical protein
MDRNVTAVLFEDTAALRTWLLVESELHKKKYDVEIVIDGSKK